MGAGRDHQHGADRQQHQATLVQEPEYWLVRQINRMIPIRPTTPSPSRMLRAPGMILPVSARLGQTIASAAPNSIPNARVSVPS